MPKGKKKSKRRFGWLRRPKRRGTKDRRIPLLPFLGGVVAPMFRAATNSNLIDSTGNINANMTTLRGFIDQIGQRYTGVSIFPDLSGVNGWHPEIMLETYTGLVGGLVGSKIASATGINRTMKKIPFVGRYIKL